MIPAARSCAYRGRHSYAAGGLVSINCDGFDQIVNALGPEARGKAGPLSISQITTTYDAKQDRLRLEVADDSGRHVVLWLTRRLADRVVTALINILESDGQLVKSRGAQPNRGKPDAVEQLMQQAAADLKFRPAAAQAPIAPSEEHLLTAISLRGQGKSLALDFRWGQRADEDAGASMMIGRVRLRQWLRIMHRVYVKSGWPVGHWPQWIRDDAASQLLSENSLH
jgi:hypothetical protein